MPTDRVLFGFLTVRSLRRSIINRRALYDRMQVGTATIITDLPDDHCVVVVGNTAVVRLIRRDARRREDGTPVVLMLQSSHDRPDATLVRGHRRRHWRRTNTGGGDHQRSTFFPRRVRPRQKRVADERETRLMTLLRKKKNPSPHQKRSSPGRRVFGRLRIHRNDIKHGIRYTRHPITMIITIIVLCIDEHRRRRRRQTRQRGDRDVEEQTDRPPAPVNEVVDPRARGSVMILLLRTRVRAYVYINY